MLLDKNFFEFHVRVQKCHFGKNVENKFQPIFQILHVKSAWFFLELAMALVTTIGMRFFQAWTTYIFFSAWDKSCVKWDTSWNSTQKMRTYVLYSYWLLSMKIKYIHFFLLLLYENESMNIHCILQFGSNLSIPDRL